LLFLDRILVHESLLLHPLFHLESHDLLESEPWLYHLHRLALSLCLFLDSLPFLGTGLPVLPELFFFGVPISLLSSQIRKAYLLLRSPEKMLQVKQRLQRRKPRLRYQVKQTLCFSQLSGGHFTAESVALIL